MVHFQAPVLPHAVDVQKDVLSTSSHLHGCTEVYKCLHTLSIPEALSNTNKALLGPWLVSVNGTSVHSLSKRLQPFCRAVTAAISQGN